MNERWVVSAYLRVGWRAGHLEFASASSGATLRSDDLDLARLLHAFARPRTIDEVLGELAGACQLPLRARIDDLIRAGMLTPASEREAAAAHRWEASALAYHRQSRRSGFVKTHAQATPAAATRPVDDPITLIRGGMTTGRDFTDVVEARRSWRSWPPVPVSFEIFSAFLWLSARDRDTAGEDRDCISRPYPSGGAAYSLELYPVIAERAVARIAAGLYRYLPELHGLDRVTDVRADFMPFLEAAARSAGTIPPPLLFLITSSFAKQSASYGELAYSLVLKEVGCLFQTFYLVAEYLGLAACALGGGAPAAVLAHLNDTSELAEPLVGEFMLGPR